MDKLKDAFTMAETAPGVHIALAYGLTGLLIGSLILGKN